MLALLTLPNLAKFAVLVAVAKFAVEGGVGVDGHILTLGHADATTYAMFLGPVLGHDYFTKKGNSNDNQV